MGREIYLKMETEFGVITIPFKCMEDVDNFTVTYSNMASLANSLIRILDLQIDLYDVYNVYLSEDKYNRGLDKECYPIKYSVDNFNYESLYEAFVTYIKNDQNRILTTDMRYLKKTKEISKYFETRYLDTCEIERAVRSFFGGTGYKRKRNTYFLIKDEEGIVIKIDKLKDKDNTNSRFSDFSQYDTGEDNYLNHLIEFARRNPEKIDQIKDEIAQFDLEQLDKLVKKDGHGFVDGVSDFGRINEREIELLEETTGLSIQVLRENHSNFGRRRNRR